MGSYHGDLRLGGGLGLPLLSGIPVLTEQGRREAILLSSTALSQNQLIPQTPPHRQRPDDGDDLPGLPAETEYRPPADNAQISVENPGRVDADAPESEDTGRETSSTAPAGADSGSLVLTSTRLDPDQPEAQRAGDGSAGEEAHGTSDAIGSVESESPAPTAPLVLSASLNTQSQADSPSATGAENPQTQAATTFTVTEILDELDDLDGFGTVSLANFGGAGDLSLREAVALSNANPGADTINFASGTGDAFEFGGTILLGGSTLYLSDSVTIDGTLTDPVHRVTLDGGGTIRMLNVTGGTTTVDQLDFTRGYAPTGGAIFVGPGSTLVLQNSTRPCEKSVFRIPSAAVLR